ncbi:MAG: hypothetical protein ACLQLG_00300 [Thermoguttaceae bacterium]
MVPKLCWPATRKPLHSKWVVAAMTVVLFCCPGPATVRAQQPDVHYWHQGVMPPGAIGSRQLQRGGPLPGFYQPVEIKAPAGTLISLANGGQFVAPQAVPCRVGLLIGSVYRLRVTNIPLPQGGEGLEVFPSIEVIDRLYAPLGQERRFAIPVELTAEDMELALAGKFVTRVIYVEDPRSALPTREISKSQHWFEVAPGQDPLAAADRLGRPVAILRLGGRLPDAKSDGGFFFGSPPYLPCPAPAAIQEKAKAAAPSAPPPAPTPGKPQP